MGALAGWRDVHYSYDTGAFSFCLLFFYFLHLERLLFSRSVSAAWEDVLVGWVAHIYPGDLLFFTFISIFYLSTDEAGPWDGAEQSRAAHWIREKAVEDGTRYQIIPLIILIFRRLRACDIRVENAAQAHRMPGGSVTPRPQVSGIRRRSRRAQTEDGIAIADDVGRSTRWHHRWPATSAVCWEAGIGTLLLACLLAFLPPSRRAGGQADADWDWNMGGWLTRARRGKGGVKISSGASSGLGIEAVRLRSGAFSG